MFILARAVLCTHVDAVTHRHNKQKRAGGGWLQMQATAPAQNLHDTSQLCQQKDWGSSHQQATAQGSVLPEAAVSSTRETARGPGVSPQAKKSECAQAHRSQPQGPPWSDLGSLGITAGNMALSLSEKTAQLAKTGPGERIFTMGWGQGTHKVLEWLPNHTGNPGKTGS